MTGGKTLRLSPLLRALRTPSEATEFSVPEWEALLWHARTARLSGRVWHHLRSGGLLASAPEPVERRLRAAFVEAEYVKELQTATSKSKATKRR